MVTHQKVTQYDNVAYFGCSFYAHFEPNNTFPQLFGFLGRTFWPHWIPPVFHSASASFCWMQRGGRMDCDHRHILLYKSRNLACWSIGPLPSCFLIKKWSILVMWHKLHKSEPQVARVLQARPAIGVKQEPEHNSRSLEAKSFGETVWFAN